MCLGEFSPSSQACVTGICTYCGVNMREKKYLHLKDCVFFGDYRARWVRQDKRKRLTHTIRNLILVPLLIMLVLLAAVIVGTIISELLYPL